MKINDLKVNESRSNYFIWYYNKETSMWCPYISEKGYQYFTEEYLQYHVQNAKNKADDVKVFRQTTERVE